MSERIAYVIVPGAKPGDRIGCVTFRESGYTRTTYDRPGMSASDCAGIVVHLNAPLGVTPNIALSMLAGSMFGWHVPGAQDAIAHFSLQGSVQRPNTEEEAC
jgi:hypothetical protein